MCLPSCSTNCQYYWIQRWTDYSDFAMQLTIDSAAILYDCELEAHRVFRSTSQDPDPTPFQLRPAIVPIYFCPNSVKLSAEIGVARSLSGGAVLVVRYSMLIYSTSPDQQLPFGWLALLAVMMQTPTQNSILECVTTLATCDKSLSNSFCPYPFLNSFYRSLVIFYPYLPEPFKTVLQEPIPMAFLEWYPQFRKKAPQEGV